MKKILWIDDEPQYLLNYSASIEKELSCKVSFAQDISYAINKISSNKYDLFIIDLLIPSNFKETTQFDDTILAKYRDYQGVALVDIIRINHAHYFDQEITDIPIIICSSYSPNTLIDLYPVLKCKNISFYSKELLNDNKIFIQTIEQTISKEKSNKSIDIEKSNVATPKLDTSPNNLDELNEYYQKIRHEYLNHYRSLVVILDDAVKFLEMKSQNANDTDEITIESLTKNAIPISIEFLNNITEVNDIKLHTNQIDSLATDISKLKGYISAKDSFQSYQIKNIALNIYSRVINFEGKANKSIRKSLLGRLDRLISYCVSYNLKDGQKLISDNLVKNVSEHYSLVTNDKRFKLKSLNVVKLLNRSINECRIVADSSKVIFNSKYDMSKVLMVIGNETMLSKAIKNIILNAIKYTERITVVDKDPWIDFYVTTQDNYVSINIENWGVKMPDKEFENLMLTNEFYRSEEAIKKRTGLGIGLYETDKIIQLHKGSISFKSDVQISKKGLTTFSINLPMSN